MTVSPNHSLMGPSAAEDGILKHCPLRSPRFTPVPTSQDPLSHGGEEMGGSSPEATPSGSHPGPSTHGLGSLGDLLHLSVLPLGNTNSTASKGGVGT